MPSSSAKASRTKGEKPKSRPKRVATGKRSGATSADEVVAELQRLGTKAVRDGMARYAIPADRAFGISVGTLKKLGKQLGPDHELALALWETGWYEARMLATFVDDPASVTPAQMERWCRDFDSWAICDTACFALFDRTHHAWGKVATWAKRREEFQKRAAFAMLASLTVHDKEADDEPFAKGLILIERAATDERNFVKKAVNWALRSIGKRSPALHAAAVSVARRLAALPEASPRWVGKDALRELTSPAVMKRMNNRRRGAK